MTWYSIPEGLTRFHEAIDQDAAIIDEIQRAPALLQAIKRGVDENRKPGSFLITGSANVMTLPKVTESIAGRMETLALLPLSQGEIRGVNNKWIDRVFAGRIPVPDRPLRGSDLVEVVHCGGYPEVLSRSSYRRRSVWIKQYLDALIQRDVLDIAEKLTILPQFLRALSLAAGQLCNYARLGKVAGKHFKGGLILHDGERLLPLGNKITSSPVSSLWAD